MISWNSGEAGLAGWLGSDDCGATVTVRTQFLFMRMIVGILHLILEIGPLIIIKEKETNGLQAGSYFWHRRGQG